MKFSVIDTATGEYPDLWKIALEEEWANGLCFCDMEGFAMEEDGTLILMDECGKHEYCPPDRFEIVPYIETRADQIRNMTDVELAAFLRAHPWNAHGTVYADDKLIDWLKQPVREDEL